MLTKLKRLYSMMGIFFSKNQFLVNKVCIERGWNHPLIPIAVRPTVPRKKLCVPKILLTFLIYRTSQFNTSTHHHRPHMFAVTRLSHPGASPLPQDHCCSFPATLALISHLKWGPGVLFQRNLFPRNLLNIDNHFGACWCFFTQFNDLLHVRVLLQFFYNL